MRGRGAADPRTVRAGEGAGARGGAARPVGGGFIIHRNSLCLKGVEWVAEGRNSWQEAVLSMVGVLAGDSGLFGIPERNAKSMSKFEWDSLRCNEFTAGYKGAKSI